MSWFAAGAVAMGGGMTTRMSGGEPWRSCRRCRVAAAGTAAVVMSAGRTVSLGKLLVSVAGLVLAGNLTLPVLLPLLLGLVLSGVTQLLLAPGLLPAPPALVLPVLLVRLATGVLLPFTISR